MLTTTLLQRETVSRQNWVGDGRRALLYNKVARVLQQEDVLSIRDAGSAWVSRISVAQCTIEPSADEVRLKSATRQWAFLLRVLAWMFRSLSHDEPSHFRALLADMSRWLLPKTHDCPETIVHFIEYVLKPIAGILTLAMLTLRLKCKRCTL